MEYDCIVIGGGAAGFFAALAFKEAHPQASVAILEKTAVLLSKVRISGGGRCNVTHSCFDTSDLSKHYPRGEKELLGPFHRFQPQDTIAWFAARGVALKTEADGRMFPVTDSSETIIACLLAEAKKLGVEILLRQKIENIEKQTSGFTIHRKDQTPLITQKLILATGSSLDGHLLAAHFGHTIQPPVPSLFTFNIPDSPLQELSGISFERVKVQICKTKFSQTGPLIITHFGFSGPAVLKLSAWAARHLHKQNYHFDIAMDWMPQKTPAQTKMLLHNLKKGSPQKTLLSENPFHFPKNFWKLFAGDSRLNDISLKTLDLLADKIHADTYLVQGKTTHKEEFVTCGGVSLKEVSFKTMESKICPGLFFAGEILDIDGVTGGFNFQNAWTTGFIAGSNSSFLATSLDSSNC